MIYEYLQRGVLAGAVSGLAYGLFMAFVANPLISYFEHLEHAHGHAQEHTNALSETTTALVSVGSGVLWAIFLGSLFALMLYFLEPAIPGRGSVKAYVLAGAGFCTVSATPWLALPPAAPGAEQLYGVETRLTIYIGLVVLGAAASAAAIGAYNRTAPNHPLLGIVAGSVPLVAVAVVVPLATPTITTHPSLPGELVSAYRAMTVLSQAGIWAILATTFSGLQRWKRAGDATQSNEQLTVNPHQ